MFIRIVLPLFYLQVMFSLAFVLFYGDFNPAKLRVNLQGKHLMLLFTFILPCSDKIATQYKVLGSKMERCSIFCDAFICMFFR